MNNKDYLTEIASDWTASLAIGSGKDAKPGSWSNHTFTLEQLKNTLTTHVEGTKDGKSFLQGSCVHGTRTAKAVDRLYIIGIDIDNGRPSSDIDALIRERGLFAIRYTSHSHLKDHTRILKDHWVKYQRTTTNATIQQYLIDKKRYLPEIAATAKITKEEQTTNGIELHVSHTPMDKNRIVFILSNPWNVMDYPSQQEALDGWRDAYLNFAAWLGVECDRSVTDVARLFYAPRHDKGAIYETVIHEGKAVDIFKVPRVIPQKKEEESNPFLDAAKDMGAFGGSTISNGVEDIYGLRKWAAKYSDSFLIHDVILQNAPDVLRSEFDSNDKHHIECPFEHEHTNHGGSGTFIINAGESNHGGFVVKCMHNSCVDRDRLEFLTKMISDGWVKTSDLYSSDYLLEMDEEDTVEEEKDTVFKESKITSSELITTIEEADEYIRYLALNKTSNTKLVLEFQKISSALSSNGIEIPTSALSKTYREFESEIKEAQKREEKRKEENKKLKQKQENEVKKVEVAVEKAQSESKALIYDGEDASVKVNKAIQAIHNKNQQNPRLFRGATGLVRIITDTNDMLRTEEIDTNVLSYEMQQACKYVFENEYGIREVFPPGPLLTTILNAPEHPFPILRGITNAPVFGPSGVINTKPGYDAESRFYYKPAKGSESVPRVSPIPSDEEIDEALELLLGNALVDFPFDGPMNGKSERAHALCLILQPFARQMIDGPTPIYLIAKPTPGTGASKLVSIFTIIAFGEKAIASTETKNEDELRKRITSMLAENAPYFYLDNVNYKVDSSSLASAVTAPMWTDRIMGQTKTVNAPVLFPWIIAGNNPKMSWEIARRCARTRLDAKVETPETRTEFKHKDLEGWVLNNRPKLIWACLTLIQNWIAKGKPYPKKVKGSFESWSNVLGGVLLAAGIEGFLENESELREDADEEGMVLRAFITCWYDHFGEQGISVSSQNGQCLFDMVKDNDIPITLSGGNNENAQKNSLGQYVSKLDGRIFTIESMREGTIKVSLHKAGKTGGVIRWKLNKEK